MLSTSRAEGRGDSKRYRYFLGVLPRNVFFTHMGLEALIELCFPAQTRKESDIEVATAQMERALRVEGWL